MKLTKKMAGLVLYIKNKIFFYVLLFVSINCIYSQKYQYIDNLLTIKWDYPKNNQGLDIPLVYKNLAFPSSIINFAIEIETGKKLYFDNPEHSRIIQSICPDSIIRYHNNDVAYFVNIYNGKVVYRTLLKAGLPIYYSPYFIKDSIELFIFNFKTLKAINIFNGKLFWEKEFDTPVFNKFLRNMENVYLADQSYIYNINVINSKVNWKKEVGETFDFILGDNVLYVSTFQRRLTAIDLSNKKTLWNQEIWTSRYLIVKNDELFLNESLITAFDKKNGEKKWEQVSGEGLDNQKLSVCGNYAFSTTQEEVGKSFFVAINLKTGNQEYMDWAPDSAGEPRYYYYMDDYEGPEPVTIAEQCYNNIIVIEMSDRIMGLEIREEFR